MGQKRILRKPNSNCLVHAMPTVHKNIMTIRGIAFYGSLPSSYITKLIYLISFFKIIFIYTRYKKQELPAHGCDEHLLPLIDTNIVINFLLAQKTHLISKLLLAIDRRKQNLLNVFFVQIDGICRKTCESNEMCLMWVFNNFHNYNHRWALTHILRHGEFVKKLKFVTSSKVIIDRRGNTSFIIMIVNKKKFSRRDN